MVLRRRRVQLRADPVPDGPVTDGDVAAANLALDTTADARNRAVRSVLQALLIVVLVDVWPIVNDALDDEAVDWGHVGKAALRVFLAGAISAVMRFLAPPPAPEG